MNKPAWQIREETRNVERFEADAYVIGGVPFWRSNDRVPPADIVQLWATAGKSVNVAAATAKRDEQTREAIDAYRRNMARRTPEQIAEQRAEARAAHGPGVTLVDVFTGERYRT